MPVWELGNCCPFFFSLLPAMGFFMNGLPVEDITSLSKDSYQTMGRIGCIVETDSDMESKTLMISHKNED